MNKTVRTLAATAVLAAGVIGPSHPAMADTLPRTDPGALIATAAGAVLLGAGASLVLLSNRRRRRFVA